MRERERERDEEEELTPVFFSSSLPLTVFYISDFFFFFRFPSQSFFSVFIYFIFIISSEENPTKSLVLIYVKKHIFCFLLCRAFRVEN